MTSQLSGSNYSVSPLNENGLRFNSSSLVSTPANQSKQDNYKSQFIEFEQYGKIKKYNELPKSHSNHLQIKIDEDYDQRKDRYEKQQIIGDNIKNKRKQQQQHLRDFQSPIQQQQQEYQEQQAKEVKIIVEYRQKIEYLSEKIIRLQEKLYYYEDYNKRLLKDLQNFKQSQQTLKKMQKQLQFQLNKKEQSLNLQKALIQNLQQKVKYLENDIEKIPTFQQKLIEKDDHLKYYILKSDQFLIINKRLQQQLKQASYTIIQLEKEIQINTYNNLLQKILKKKQNILTPFNIENYSVNGNNNPRRSFGSYKIASQKTKIMKTQPQETASKDHDCISFTSKKKYYER